MWPSTLAFRGFENVACPSGPSSCELPYCIFSHDGTSIQTPQARASSKLSPLDGEPVAKRLKLDNGGILSAKQPDETSDRTAEPQVFVGSIVSKSAQEGGNGDSSSGSHAGHAVVNGKSSEALPRTATRPVSPPPKKDKPDAPRPPEVEVRLTPRKLPKEPTSFARRLTMLKTLHQYMSPLNSKVARAVKPEIKALHLNANQLNKLAVDEEEKVAKENASVYDNVLKQRLVNLKKMTVEEWVKARWEAGAKERGDEPKKPPQKKFDTGLTPKEEVTMLSTLFASQTSLDVHGVVIKQSTESELEQAKAAQTLSDSWEVCDRCGTRFQVFQDRREEDGALTTGGKCQHHWGKKIFPKRVKGQTSSELPRLTCCNEQIGSPGCTTHDTHVYKVSDAKRMSLFMPFIETPENDNVEPHAAVCFDCEMGYTTHGLELLRLTSVAWPSHRPLVDVLVRPLGHVLDLNTRFSGITAEQFLNAKPYDPKNPKPVRKDLRIVDSPYAARDLFLAHVSPTIPVLGHAIENDLNVIRLIHPTIVDTVIIFPTRNGLPYRHGLKTLAKMHLDIDIQQGGAAGHDSYEDARTTGELVRFKILENWRKLKNEGWTISDEGVNPPLPKGVPPISAPLAPSMVGSVETIVDGSAEKRKRDESQGNGVGDGPPVKRQA